MDALSKIPTAELSIRRVRKAELTAMYIGKFEHDNFIMEIFHNHEHQIAIDALFRPNFGHDELILHFSHSDLIQIRMIKGKIYHSVQIGLGYYIINYQDCKQYVHDVPKLLKMLIEHDTDIAKYALSKVLPYISYDELLKLVLPRDLKLSRDRYNSLRGADNIIGCAQDFTLRCNDGVEVKIHKFLLCMCSNVVRDYLGDVAPTPNDMKLPFDSRVVNKLVDGLYNQRFTPGGILVDILDYLMILSRESVIDMYIAALKAKS